MAPPEQSSEQLLPSPEAAKQQINAKLAEIARKPLNGQVKAAVEALQKEMPELKDPEALKSINDLMESAVKLFATINPMRLKTLLDRVQAYVVNKDFKSLNNPELGKLLQAPTGAEQAEKTEEGEGGTIEKLMAMIEKMGKTLSALGSGTLATIERFCGGPDTVFGKLFGSLKELPESQRVYLAKEIRKRNIKLSAETNMVKIVDMMRTQVVAARDLEQVTKGTQTYDFLRHCDLILPALAVKKVPLDDNVIQDIGKEELAKQETKWKNEALATKPQTAAPGARIKLESTPLDVKLAVEGTDKVTVEKADKKVTFKIDGVTMSLSQDIKSAEVVSPQGTQKGTVELVTTDDKKITIQTPEIAAKSKDKANKTLVAVKEGTPSEAIEVPITFA